MAKIKYYYDTESCSFEKANWDGPTILRTVLSYTLISGLIAVGMVIYMFYFASNPITNQLRQDNRAEGGRIGQRRAGLFATVEGF